MHQRKKNMSKKVESEPGHVHRSNFDSPGHYIYKRKAHFSFYIVRERAFPEHPHESFYHARLFSRARALSHTAYTHYRKSIESAQTYF